MKKKSVDLALAIKASKRDVRAHFSDVVINLLGLWEHPGNIELYFKHRYK